MAGLEMAQDRLARAAPVLFREVVGQQDDIAAALA